MKYSLSHLSLYLAVTLTSSHLTNNVYSQNQSDQVDLSQYSAYSESIKNCTKSTFKIPDILRIGMLKLAQASGANVSSISVPPITFEIMGWQSGKCQLKITQVIPSANGKPDGFMITNCMFSQDDLQILSASAVKYASGQDISGNDPATTIMESACTMGN